MWKRGSDEFTRVVTFSDAVFAIAMTLLVTGVAVPNLDDPNNVGDLAEALGDESDSIVSFFVSFAVIGRYWLAHHAFFSELSAIDRGLVASNLLYLAFVAFLPFPTALLGDLFDNPLSIAIYATAVAVVSGLEVVQFRIAYRHGLLAKEMAPSVYRWGTLMSLSPVIFFLASIPVAFAFGSGWAIGVWLAIVPFQLIAERWEPEGASEFTLD